MAKNQTKVKIPGRKGAIARLALLFVMVAVGVLTSVLTLPGYIERLGAGRAIPEAIAGCATLFFVGAWIWAAWKWISVVGKKTLRCVIWVWNNWDTFFIIGFVIKFLLWLFCHFVPTVGVAYLFAPLVSILADLAAEGVTLPVAMALLLGSSLLVLIMAAWDIRWLATRKRGAR